MKYRTIVNSKELAEHLNDPDWIVFDCRFTLTDTEAGRRAYNEGHILGARYAHLNEDLASPVTEATGRHPLPEPDVLAEKLGQWGVNAGKQVVAYDNSFGAMAGRMWWLLRWLGHDNVALLDGGLPSWMRAGQPMTTDAPGIVPTTFTPNLRPEMIVDATDVEQAVEGDKCLLIDARSEERFVGEVEPLDKVAGHVPGAINIPFEDNLDLDGTFLSPDEMWEFYQGKPEKTATDQVIAMCGSGVTACHNILAMEIAGITGARLYVGSWSEWITDPKRPIAIGKE